MKTPTQKLSKSDGDTGVRDLRAVRDDLERRVHDLRLTRQVSMQSLPGIRLVQELHGAGLALVVIEHNMRVIMELSQRVVALALGEVIADGPPEAIVRDHRVIDAYLGSEHADA